MANKTTCFLFGDEACELWYEYIGSAENFIPMLQKMQTDYDIFYFVEGVTSPEELLLAFDGWNDWSILPKEICSNHLKQIQ